MNNSILEKIFTKSYSGLKSQGFTRSLGISKHTQQTICVFHDHSDPSCVRKCAIGWLDDQETMTETSNLLNITNVDWIRNQLDSSELHLKVRDLLLRLRDAHDQGNTPQTMQNKLQSIARDYGFQLPS